MWCSDSKRFRISFNLLGSVCVEVAILSANWPKIEWHCSWAEAESKLSNVVDCVGSLNGNADDAAGGSDDDDGGGSRGGGGELVCGGGDAVLNGGGWYFAVEYGNGRPSAVVFTVVWLAADDCIGNATRLFKLVRGFAAFVGWLVAAAAVGIGGGSFQPGS